MKSYSFNPMTVRLDTEHFGEEYYLTCKEYTAECVAADMRHVPSDDDEFILTYTDAGEIKAIKSEVYVDFDNTPSNMWEGAFPYMTAIMSTNNNIADEILKAIKEKTTFSAIVNTKRILDPDEADIASLDPEDVQDYFNAHIITINPNEFGIK